MAIYKTEQTVNDETIIMYIEMDDGPEDSGLENLPSRLVDTSRDVFGEGMKLARNCAARAMAEISEMNDKVCPDEFELKFGVNLDTEIGAVLAKMGAETQLQITMKWKRPSGTLRPKRIWDQEEIPY